MRIAVIVLNFNGLKDTLECLDSLKKCQRGGHQVEIIVVDNNSSDGSYEALSQLKDINLIVNEQNLGYTGGNNVGIKYALNKKSQAVLILNNDTIVDPLLIVHLAQALKSAQIISPKIYFAPGFEFHKDRYQKKDQGKIIWYAGGKIDWENIIGIHRGVDEVDKGQYNKKQSIDFATGASIFVKREVFEKIGYFDQKYFLYLEDLDFCVRARRAGFSILFEPKAVLWHKNALTSGGSGSSLQDYFISRNRLLFAAKFAPWRTKVAVFRQLLRQLGTPIKRRAFFDFLTLNFDKGSMF